MRRLILTFAVLLGLSCSVLPSVQAEDNAPAKTKVKKRVPKGSMSKVAQALAEAGYFTETEAKPRAKFYIFICSASWCGPCRALMPKVVEEYETKMKKNRNVSLVLMGYDQTEEAALKYIQHYETDIPGILGNKAELENAPQVRGIPAYFILNAKGDLIASGMGNQILNWEEQIKNKPQRGKKNKR